MEKCTFRESMGDIRNSKEMAAQYKYRCKPLAFFLFMLRNAKVCAFHLPIRWSASSNDYLNIPQASRHISSSVLCSMDSFVCRSRHTLISRKSRKSVKFSMLSPSTMTMDDFPQILEALSAYKKIHGHLRVPSHYVIRDGEGPEDLWGMRLGNRIEELIREKDRYTQLYPDRVQLLRNMGFEWSIEQPVQGSIRKGQNDKRWEDFFSGMRAFSEVYGHSKIGDNFIVPDSEPWPATMRNTPLGSQAAQIRNSGRSSLGSKKCAALDSIGFTWNSSKSQDKKSATSWPFESVLEALQVYNKLFGHVVVPSSFIVPRTEEWPVRLWGLALGQTCFSIRSRNLYVKDNDERRVQLANVGFDCDPKHQTTDTKFRKLFNALMLYKEKYGSVDVPFHFVVPHEEPWPKDWWDMKLGSSLMSIRNTGTYVKSHPSRRAMLEAVGFDLEPRLDEAKERRKMERQARAQSADSSGDEEASVAAYLAETANQKLTLPPTKIRAAGDGTQSLLDSLVESMKTDHTMVTAAKARQAAEEEPMKIDIPGITKPKKVLDSIKELTGGLERYVKEEVPMETWPKVTGIDNTRRMISLLGSTAIGGTGYISKETTAAAGASTLFNAATQAAANAAALAADTPVNADFNLGKSVEGYGGWGYSSERKVERSIPPGVSMSDLDWMTEEERMTIAVHGFEWDEFQGGFTFDQVVQALKHYKNLYGDIDIGDDFQVPHDYEWPRDLSGMMLGAICAQFRCGDIDAREDPERREALDEIGFLWKEKFGEEDDYLLFQWNEVLCGLYSCNMIRGEIDLEPAWVVPDENPWPLPLRGMPLGFLLNVVRSQKDILFRHYHERFLILYGMGITWLEPMFVDWEDITVRGVGDGNPLPGPFEDILEAAEHLKPFLLS